MSETFFSVNDLLRRRLQTGLVILGLSLCEGSTIFLLLFADRLGFGISLRVEDSLTLGVSSVFSNFFIFIAFLVLLVGAVVSSFLSFVMMRQRVKDIGLIRAAGCPSDVLFGYFFNQLVITALASCLLGTIFGMLADCASIGIFHTIGLQIAQKTPNFWLALVVFTLFFALILAFGSKPVVNATRVSPVEALSPKYYVGLTKETISRVIPRSHLTVGMAMRNLSRHLSVTSRLALCLITVVVLMTVAIAGGIIAQQTTTSWVEGALGEDVVLVAHKDICSQYALLLSEFHGSQALASLNYTAEEYLVPQLILLQVNQTRCVANVDPRFITMQDVAEIPGNVYDKDTLSTVTVGDHRKGESLIVGVDPDSIMSHWFMQGELLREDSLESAVVGDSIAIKMFNQPLVQSITFSDAVFRVSGVCVDPVHNGKVTYVHIKALETLYGVSGPNVLFIGLDRSLERANALDELTSLVVGLKNDFDVYELREVVKKNAGFLSYVWSAVATVPLLTAAAAAFCLADYVALTTSQQRVEFGILRAVGARPKTVLKIVIAQNSIVLFASFGAGVAVGLMLSLLFLVQKPFFSAYGVLEMSIELLSVLGAIFVFSLYPSIRFARKSTVELIQES